MFGGGSGAYITAVWFYELQRITQGCSPGVYSWDARMVQHEMMLE